MSDNIIQKEEIVNLIRNELTTVMEENYNLYKDYNVIIAVEQEFDKHAKNGLKDKNIYIVLKFGAASINYGQTVLPVSFTVLSEQNKCDISFKLLTDFVNKYNLEINQDKTIRQVYESPSVSSNFNAVYEGYRSILTISAFFVISKNANFFDFQYGIDDENVTIIYDFNSFEFGASSDFIEKVEIFDSNKFENFISNYYDYLTEQNTLKISVTRLKVSTSFIWYVINTTNSLKNVSENENIAELTDYGLKVYFKNNQYREKMSNTFFIKFEKSETIKTNYYDIPVITSSFSGDFYPDTQPFYNVSNFGTSAIKTGQLVVSFTTFLLDNIEVVNDALSVALKKSCVNKTFKFKINFKNEALTTEDNFKLINLNAKQDIGDIPMISLTFSL